MAARHLIEREQARDDLDASLDEKAEFAIREGREDLARAAIGYRAAIAARREELARALAALNDEASALEDAIRALTDREDGHALKVKLDELDRMFSASRGKLEEES